LNPFNSNWFKWIDAGIFLYRDVKPPSHLFPKNLAKLSLLPKDKFIFSSSTQDFDISLTTRTNYYHHVSGTFLIHKNFISHFAEIYKQYLEKLVSRNNIWTDQVILTHIYKDHPEIFCKLCHGYGEITRYLFS
jgi:hypothetical protein